MYYDKNHCVQSTHLLKNSLNYRLWYPFHIIHCKSNIYFCIHYIESCVTSTFKYQDNCSCHHVLLIINSCLNCTFVNILASRTTTAWILNRKLIYIEWCFWVIHSRIYTTHSISYTVLSGIESRVNLWINALQTSLSSWWAVAARAVFLNVRTSDGVAETICLWIPCSNADMKRE